MKTPRIAFLVILLTIPVLLGAGSEEVAPPPREADPKDFEIQWSETDVEAARERTLLLAPRPQAPDWVHTQAERFIVRVAFSLLPDGSLQDAEVSGSSGYDDVDTAVLEALRAWKFSAANTEKTIRGLASYFMRPE